MSQQIIENLEKFLMNRYVLSIGIITIINVFLLMIFKILNPESTIFSTFTGLYYLEGGLTLILGGFLAIGNWNPSFSSSGSSKISEIEEEIIKDAKKKILEEQKTMSKKEIRERVIQDKNESMKTGLFVIIVGLLLLIVGSLIDILLFSFLPEIRDL